MVHFLVGCGGFESSGWMNLRVDEEGMVALLLERGVEAICNSDGGLDVRECVLYWLGRC